LSRLQEALEAARRRPYRDRRKEQPLQLGRAMSATKNPWAVELLRLGRRTFGTVPEQGAALELAGCAPVEAATAAPAPSVPSSPASPSLVGRAVARFQPRPPLERVGRAVRDGVRDVREGVRDGGRLLLGPGAVGFTPADCSLGE
jgi:hypothetical protein